MGGSPFMHSQAQTRREPMHGDSAEVEAGLVPHDPIDIDEVFTEHIGEFGRHQKWLFVIASLPWLSGAFLTYNLTFAGKDPVKERLWECTQPDDVACAEAFASEDVHRAFVALPRDAWQWTAPEQSIVSDLSPPLIGDRAWLNQFANSAYFFGFLLGAAAWGTLSDRYGRRPTLLACLVLSGIVTGGSALMQGYTAVFLSRIVQGIVSSGVGLISFTLASELVGPNWRGTIGIATQFFWCGGEVLLPGLARLVPNWRPFTALCGLSVIIPLLFTPWLPESPRWLLTHGHVRKSTAALKAIAAGNGASMPARPLLVATSRGPSATLWDTFRVPELRRRMAVMMTAWCFVSLGYYGVALALDALPGSLYLKFFGIALIEFPSYFAAMMLLERAGRNKLTTIFFAICGAACLLCAFLPDAKSGSSTSGALRISAAVAGKFGAAAAFILLYVYTIELFPTVVRNAALGANSSAARMGGVLAPLVVLVANQLHAPVLSFAVFGVTSLIAGGLLKTMPETQGTTLPDTIEDVSGAAPGGRAPEWDGVPDVDDRGDGDARFVISDDMSALNEA